MLLPFQYNRKVVIYATTLMVAITQSTVSKPEAVIQSLMNQVQIQAMSDLSDETVTINSADSYQRLVKLSTGKLCGGRTNLFVTVK